MQRKILAIISIITGLLFINSGLNKFFNYMPPPSGLSPEAAKDMAALLAIAWLMPLVAIAEIIGGLLLLFRKTRALGALVIFPIAVGILLIHATVMPSGLVIALVIWVILLWILYADREKYLGLLR